MQILRSTQASIKTSWYWFKDRAHGRAAQWWLIIASFLDSWALFFPPEVLLAAIVAAGSKRWVYYAGLTTFVSVLGALFAYVIGFLFFDTLGAFIIDFLGNEEAFQQAAVGFSDNAFLILLLAVLTPFPSVPVVIAAGFFKINIFVFVVAVFLGRAIRFFGIAFIVRVFGERTLALVSKYANIAMIVVTVALVVFLLFYFDIL